MSDVRYSTPVFPVQQVFTAIITEVDSDLNIYFRITPETGTQPIQRVNEAIENTHILPSLTDEQFKIGRACTAKRSTNGSWHRAEIERISGVNSQEVFAVRLVDVGTLEIINRASLSSKVITPEIPKLALRGYLYKLKRNEFMKSELQQKFKDNLIDKVVDIRWENFLAQFFPMQIKIKIPGQGVFKPLPEEANNQKTNNILNSTRRVMYTLEAMKVNLNGTLQKIESMNINQSQSRNGTVSKINNDISKVGNSNDTSKTDLSVRPKLRSENVKDELQTKAHSQASTELNLKLQETRVSLEKEAKRLSRMPDDVLQIIDAINKSPFQELHPELLSNVYYPVIICEHVAENFCFLQTIPIEQPSDEELAITIRHTMFMSLIEQMRNEVNTFNLVGDNLSFGQPVCAQFEDEEWYRAVIMSTSPTGRKSKVLYVDYGNTREVTYNQLRELPERFIKALPTHAFLVKLYNIRPSQKEIWQPKYSNKLRDTLADIEETLVAIFCRSGYPLEMDIYLVSAISDRVPCKHPLQKLVDSGDFEFVTSPVV